MPPAAEARSPPALRGAPARPTVRYVWYYYQTPLSVFFFLRRRRPLAVPTRRRRRRDPHVQLGSQRKDYLNGREAQCVVYAATLAGASTSTSTPESFS